jgi:acyl carrier protein
MVSRAKDEWAMISDRLKHAILSELGLDEFDLRDETLAGEVPGWDSLSHVRIISAVEAEYGARFKTLELLKLRNVGDLQVLVDRHAPK